MKKYAGKDTIIIKDLITKKKKARGEEKRKKNSLGSQAKLSSYIYKKRKIKLGSDFFPANSTPQVKGRKPTKYLRKGSMSEGIGTQPRILYP